MVEKDAVRRAYDAIAETYAARRTADPPGVQLLDSLPAESRVLDAGCGSGQPVLSRLSDSTTAIGVDFSREQLLLAAENVPGAALVRGDIATLPFDDDTFDGVVAYWSLIHVPATEHQSVVDEFARVLRPDGRVLLNEGTDEWTGTNPDWLDSGVEMQWHIAGVEATRTHLRDAGFEITETWRAADDLTAGSDSSDEDDELPWVFFAARLDR